MFEDLLKDAYNKIAEIGTNAQEIATRTPPRIRRENLRIGWQGRENDPKDVLAIRMLLNGFIASDARMKLLKSLDLAQTINGWNDMDPTITAIVWFQRQGRRLPKTGRSGRTRTGKRTPLLRDLTGKSQPSPNPKHAR